MGYKRVPQRHNKQMVFLSALAKGKTPLEAARLAGVPWPTFYTWRRKHTRFRKAWDKARAYGATPDFPPPSELARRDLASFDAAADTWSADDGPAEIEYRDVAAHDLVVALGLKPKKPLPKNFIVTQVPESEWPKVEAWVESIPDAGERAAARQRWLSRPPLPNLRPDERARAAAASAQTSAQVPTASNRRDTEGPETGQAP